MVFDEDVDIWNDNAILSAMAFRYMPHRDTLMLPGSNTITANPRVGADTSPLSASKIGFDCTSPLVGGFDPQTFDPSSVCDLGNIPEQNTLMREETLTQDMESFIQDKARSWKEILQQYHGQPYPLIYKAFSNLRK